MSWLRRHPVALVASVLLHVGAVGLLSLNIGSKPKPPVAQPQVEVIEAVAVDSRQVEAALDRFREVEREKQRKIEADKRRKEEARQARQREEERKVADEQKRKAAVAAAAEQKRQAEIKQREEAAARKKAEETARRKAEEEKARLAEQARQRKIAEEKQRQAEEERKRREEQARVEAQRQVAEAALKDRMAAEARRMAADRQAREQREMDRQRAIYISDIRNKVQRNWVRPAGIPPGTRCTVIVQQIPGGDVVGVRALDCTGDVAFQRSVEAAVRKASPLPEPPDASLFDREIEFNFEVE